MNKAPGQYEMQRSPGHCPQGLVSGVHGLQLSGLWSHSPHLAAAAKDSGDGAILYRGQTPVTTNFGYLGRLLFWTQEKQL